MTNQEFSNAFDTLISSFSREIPFGKESGDIVFDEYEKSVFLTQAQEELILSLYNGKNSNGNAFENSEEVRRYLVSLVKPYTDTTEDATEHKISRKSSFHKLPNDCWFIIYESVDWDPKEAGCITYQNIQVTPITHDEYHKVKNNPFRGPNDRQVLRLDIKEKGDSDILVELISKYKITKYYCRYIAKPSPIILSNLPDDLEIRGIKVSSPCVLHEALHNQILTLAVNKALQSKGINIRNQQQ